MPRRQHGAHPRLEEGIVPARRIATPLLLRERDRPLGQALEHEVVDVRTLGQLDRRLDPVAGVAGSRADAHDARQRDAAHSASTPNSTAAATIARVVAAS